MAGSRLKCPKCGRRGEHIRPLEDLGYVGGKGQRRNSTRTLVKCTCGHWWRSTSRRAAQKYREEFPEKKEP